ncbi:TDH-like protein [Mya arenaria]|uniref:TDH-like protein n=1 Tax=Mya arenaria TaxID=6604 RepID=A0ABY7DEK9_MYAAR|nr:TDH-like protein [Mya arenaria]
MLSCEAAMATTRPPNQVISGGVGDGQRHVIVRTQGLEEREESSPTFSPPIVTPATVVPSSASISAPSVPRTLIDRYFLYFGFSSYPDSGFGYRKGNSFDEMVTVNDVLLVVVLVHLLTILLVPLLTILLVILLVLLLTILLVILLVILLTILLVHLLTILLVHLLTILLVLLLTILLVLLLTILLVHLLTILLVHLLTILLVHLLTILLVHPTILIVLLLTILLVLLLTILLVLLLTILLVILLTILLVILLTILLVLPPPPAPPPASTTSPLLVYVPKTMKVLIKNHEMESYEYTDMDVPEPEGDEVLIKVDAVSICGSDIPLYKWSPMARVIATVPFIPGHEAAGTVVKCGPEADLEIGSRVGVENHFNCGDCFQCRQDQREICQHMGQYGHGRKTKHGGCSEYSIVPQKYLFKITKDLSKFLL